MWPSSWWGQTPGWTRNKRRVSNETRSDLRRPKFPAAAGLRVRSGVAYRGAWVLVLATVAFALNAFAAMPVQRRATHLWNWAFRFFIGCMWWQQTLWKLPPYYTDHPDQPFGATGLAYWMGLVGKSAAIPQQAEFVNNIVLPHFYVFAPVVYSLEVLTAVSLMLGIFVRFWGVIGALQILNLWLGLYNA